jgi:hypothetical protein
MAPPPVLVLQIRNTVATLLGAITAGNFNLTPAYVGTKRLRKDKVPNFPAYIVSIGFWSSEWLSMGDEVIAPSVDIHIFMGQKDSDDAADDLLKMHADAVQCIRTPINGMPLGLSYVTQINPGASLPNDERDEMVHGSRWRELIIPVEYDLVEGGA